MLVVFLEILILSCHFAGTNLVLTIPSLELMPIMTQKEESHGCSGIIFLTSDQLCILVKLHRHPKTEPHLFLCFGHA